MAQIYVEITCQNNFYCLLKYYEFNGCKGLWDCKMLQLKNFVPSYTVLRRCGHMRSQENVMYQFYTFQTILVPFFAHYACSAGILKVCVCIGSNTSTFKERGGGQTFSISFLIRFRQVPLCRYECKGPITIRRTPLPTFLVNFSTFAFLLNFSFMK